MACWKKSQVPRSQIQPHTCAQHLLHCPLSGTPTCKAHPTPFLLKCKSFFNVLVRVCVYIYAREREWVYGYEWVCTRTHTHTHTHTLDVEKSLWHFQASKLIRKFSLARAPALCPCPLPLPPWPCSCSKSHFLPKSPGPSYFPISF